MKILYVTSEAVPFIKTGGLADVAGSLPPSLAAQGAEVAVVLPLYDKVKAKFGDQLNFVGYDYVDLSWRHVYCGLFSVEQDGVTWYFLDNEQYFKRPNLYGYGDDAERFGFFSLAVVNMLSQMKFWPDVIHCNDWQSALVPIYLKEKAAQGDERYGEIRTALSIHNIEYQGRYGMNTLSDVFGLHSGWAADGTIEMDGDVNLLKGAILCADAINAVSPTYANELKQAFFAHHMENVIQSCDYKLYGVLNGIDLVGYNPETDKRIAATYSIADMSGKAEDKAALQRMMGLNEDPNVPVVAMVSRLVAHKGLDLISEALHDIMQLPVQLVILGKGDEKYESFFAWAAQQYPGRMSVTLDYNESLSMAIYSGADLFLMPSKSEPCGLSQMIAMRYGTLPIVRETGGLKDSVQPYEAWRDAGNGFTFANYSSSDMLYVISQAVALYYDDHDAFLRLRQRAMEADFSWDRSAQAYLDIYSHITGMPWKEEAAPAEEAVPFEEAAPAEETAPVTEETAPVEEKPAPKKRATRKKKEETSVEAAEAAEEKPAPKKRATRKKKEEASAEAVAETAEEKPAPKKRATRKKKEEAPAEAAAEVSEEKPVEAAAETVEEKPAKKTTAKKTTAAKTAKKSAVEE